MEREKTRPARPVGCLCATKLAQQAQNRRKTPFLGVLGELIRGRDVGRCVLGEFCTGWAAGGVCWESFVPVGLLVWACWESFVPVGPTDRLSRESFVPGGLLVWVCGESFVPGERLDRLNRGSFVPVGRVGRLSRESFVPGLVLGAVQSSPCWGAWWCERYKVLPARAKRAEMGNFGCAGRVLYRLGCWCGCVGRVLYRRYC